MQRAVVFGAGNIGRGFIGLTLNRSGYRVTFVDVVQAVVDGLNAGHAYPVEIVSDEAVEAVVVQPIDAVSALDVDAVAAAVAEADLGATAVGVNALPKLAPTLAAGLRRRWAQGNSQPLDFIVCENKLEADRYLRDLIRAQLNEADARLLDQRIGFVEASIGRMVPVMSEEVKRRDPLLIQVEPYHELPVDAAGFRGPIPRIEDLKPFSPFDFYIQRKLFVHNLGHAVTAYLGWLYGYERVAAAIAEPRIRDATRSAMLASALALAEHYQINPTELVDHVDDLLYRFANRRLGDQVTRVGKDPLRKLGPQDRLSGALQFVLKQGGDPSPIALGIAAALLFDPADDPDAQSMRQTLADRGADAFLAEQTGLNGAPELDAWRKAILRLYDALAIGHEAGQRSVVSGGAIPNPESEGGKS